MARLIKIINRLMLVTILFSFVQYFVAGAQTVRAETTNHVVLDSPYASATMTPEPSANHIKWQAHVFREAQPDSRLGFIAVDEQGKQLPVSSNQLTKQTIAGKEYALEPVASGQQATFEFTTPASERVTIYTVLLDAQQQLLGSNTAGTQFDTAVTQPAAPTTPPRATRAQINDWLPNKTIFTAAAVLNNAGQPVAQVEVGTKVIVRYDWQLPEAVRKQMAAGDTFDFELPAYFKLSEQLTGDLKDDTGKVFGTYTVKENGQVQFVFSDLVTKYNGIKGTFFVSGKVTLDEAGELPEIKIPFVESENVTVPKVVAVNSRVLSKSVLTKDYNGAIQDDKVLVDWGLHINKTSTTLEAGATITDTLPVGVTYQGIKDFRAYRVGVDGKLHAEAGVQLAAVFEQQVSNDDRTITFKLKDTANRHLYYEIDYTTEVDLDLARGKVTTKSFKIQNAAQLVEKDEVPITAFAQLTFAYNVTFAKTGQMQPNGTIKWVVQATRTGGMSIPKGIVLTDTLGQGQVLTDEMGTALTTFPSAVQTTDGAKILASKVSAGSYRFTFDQAYSGKAFEMTYYSKSPNQTATAFTNTLKWGSATQGSGSVPVKSEVTKTAANLDAKAGTVDFEITMNRNGWPLTALALVDTMGNDNLPGLSVTAAQLAGLKVYRQSTTTPNAAEQEVPRTGYSLTPTGTAPHTKFQIDLNAATLGTAGTTDMFIVRYQAHVDQQLADHDQRNTAKMIYEVNGTSKEASADCDVDLTPSTSVSGSKSGAVHPAQGTVDWTMVVNPNRQHILGEDGVLIDTLPAALTLNGGQSGPVSPAAYTVMKNGQAVPDDQIKATYTKGTLQTVAFTGFEAGANEYTIVLTTDIVLGKDGVLPLLNKVTNTFSYQDTQVHTGPISAAVSYNPTNELLAKAALQDGDEVQYTVTVNRDTKENPADNKLLLKDVVITDHPDDAKLLRIDPKSVQVLDNNNDPIDSKLYSLLSGERGFELKFATLRQEVRISYTGHILFPAGTYPGQIIKPKNTVTVTGNKIKAQQTNDKVKLTYPEAGGSAQGELGAIKVTKTDAVTDKPLTGAKFSLYRVNDQGGPGDGIYFNEAVNDQGEFLFEDLTMGDYLLYETDAPAGYAISPEFEAGYRVTVDHNGTTNTTAVTVPNAPVTSYEGQKIWADADNVDGARPAAITVHLLANGKPTDREQLVSERNGWQYSFTDLPRVDDAGDPITYSVVEATVDHYMPEYKQTDIVNHHEPELVEIQGRKIWRGANAHPDAVVIHLLADGEAIASQTVTAADQWQYAFKDLPKYQAGQEIAYTITEDAVPNYTTHYAGYDVINEYTPGTTSVTVTKAWQDDNNQAGLRPANIRVQLYANGQAMGDAVPLDEAGKWTHTWTGLAMTDAAGTIAYTVRELGVPDGYTVTADNENHGNIILTNTYQSRETSVTGTKTWDDDGNRHQRRPDQVVVNLLADNVVVASQTVTAKTNWQYQFRHLPVYADGRKINYTITEDAVRDYSTTVHGFDLTNRYTPGKTSVTVVKAWRGDDVGARPNRIRVQLRANGKAVGKPVTLRRDGGWTHTWQNLPLVVNGKPIVYTAAEMDVPAGYVARVDQLDAGNIRITNTQALEPEKPTPPVNPGDPTPPVTPGKPTLPNKPGLPGTPVSPTRPTAPHLPGGSADGGGIGSGAIATSPAAFPQTGNDRTTWLAVLGTCLLMAVGTGAWLLRRRVKA